MIDATLAADAKKFLGQFANMVNFIKEIADKQPDLAELDALVANKKIATDALADVKLALADEQAKLSAANLTYTAKLADIAAADKAATDMLTRAKAEASEIVAKAYDQGNAILAELELEYGTRKKVFFDELMLKEAEVRAAREELAEILAEIEALKARING